MGAHHIKSGFTIVELLIVIVVIGILTTIAVVAYRGITNQGYDAAVKSDLSTFASLKTFARYAITSTSTATTPYKA
jgi:prepilin-type N-terminal cleavage/methylation domain-containing protein